MPQFGGELRELGGLRCSRGYRLLRLGRRCRHDQKQQHEGQEQQRDQQSQCDICRAPASTCARVVDVSMGVHGILLQVEVRMNCGSGSGKRAGTLEESWKRVTAHHKGIGIGWQKSRELLRRLPCVLRTTGDFLSVTRESLQCDVFRVREDRSGQCKALLVRSRAGLIRCLRFPPVSAHAAGRYSLRGARRCDRRR